MRSRRLFKVLLQLFFLSLTLAPAVWARTPPPPMHFFHADQSLSSADQILGWVFIGTILAGGVLIILATLTDIVFAAPGYRSFLSMYVAVWAGYAIWYLDVRFGLPFGVTRFQILPVFLGGIAALLLFRETMDFLKEYLKPLEKGMIRCPRCREIYSELMIECPECRTKNKYA